MEHLKNSEDFDNIIKEGKVVVDFFATWCGPCKMLAPVLEEVSKEHEDIKFLSVDTDEFSDLAQRFGIMSIPTVKVFVDGEEKNSNVGFMDKEQIEEFIK